MPWPPGSVPLMLAPMQGLTNRALRQVQYDIAAPDVLFTEFIRVREKTPRLISAVDRTEVQATAGAPLVAQLIGQSAERLAQAAVELQQCGVRHINLNLGCPFGRMVSGSSGGAMLRQPELVYACVRSLRRVVTGSFSVKVRAGFDDSEQIFSLLPMFAGEGVDFIVVHPRTVVQKYAGSADHTITARVVAATALPVIANGDVVCARQGRELLRDSGAAGLMLGRAAIADPLLFQRLRRPDCAAADPQQRRADAARYLTRLLAGYSDIFCGDQQILGKIKAVLACFSDVCFDVMVFKLRRCRSVAAFSSELRRWQ